MIRPPLLGRRVTLLGPVALAMEKSQAASVPPPATSQIIAFALPVLGACLAEPLLSMIDTLAIGRLSQKGASAALAALGVNAAIFNVIACSTAFLCTASTAVVGSLPASAGVGYVGTRV